MSFQTCPNHLPPNSPAVAAGEFLSLILFHFLLLPILFYVIFIVEPKVGNPPPPIPERTTCSGLEIPSVS